MYRLRLPLYFALVLSALANCGSNAGAAQKAQVCTVVPGSSWIEPCMNGTRQCVCVKELCGNLGNTLVTKCVLIPVVKCPFGKECPPPV